MGSLVIVLFVASIFGAMRDSGNPIVRGNTALTDTTQSEPSALSDPYIISASDAISVISGEVGSHLNQNDVTRGIMFPGLSPLSGIWSIPYLTLLIYPDSNSLQANQSTFESDFANFAGNFSWISCNNLMAVYESRYSEQIDRAISHWCTY